MDYKNIEGQREMAVEHTTEYLSLSKKGQRDRCNPICAPKTNNALGYLSSLRESTHIVSFWNPREKVKHSKIDKHLSRYIILMERERGGKKKLISTLRLSLAGVDFH